jgi:hypothetical protein
LKPGIPILETPTTINDSAFATVTANWLVEAISKASIFKS